MGGGNEEQVLALVLHSVLGQQRIQLVTVILQMAGIAHIHRHLCASVAVPAVYALHDADAAHNVGPVKGIQVGLKHTAHGQIPHFDAVVDEIGQHLIAGPQFQAVGHQLRDRDLL